MKTLYLMLLLAALTSVSSCRSNNTTPRVKLDDIDEQHKDGDPKRDEHRDRR